MLNKADFTTCMLCLVGFIFTGLTALTTFGHAMTSLATGRDEDPMVNLIEAQEATTMSIYILTFALIAAIAFATAIIHHHQPPKFPPQFPPNT